MDDNYFFLYNNYYNNKRPFNLQKIAKAVNYEPLLNKKEDPLIPKRKIIRIGDNNKTINKAIMSNHNSIKNSIFNNIKFSFHPKVFSHPFPKERPYTKVLRNFKENDINIKSDINIDFNFQKKINLKTLIESGKSAINSSVHNIDYSNYVPLNDNDSMFITANIKNNDNIIKADIVNKNENLDVNDKIDILTKNGSICINCLNSKLQPLISKKVFEPEKYENSLSLFKDDIAFKKIQNIDHAIRKIIYDSN